MSRMNPLIITSVSALPLALPATPVVVTLTTACSIIALLPQTGLVCQQLCGLLRRHGHEIAARAGEEGAGVMRLALAADEPQMAPPSGRNVACRDTLRGWRRRNHRSCRRLLCRFLAGRQILNARFVIRLRRRV